MNAFTCPECEQGYAPRWRASDQQRLARMKARRAATKETHVQDR